MGLCVCVFVGVKRQDYPWRSLVVLMSGAHVCTYKRKGRMVKMKREVLSCSLERV